MQSSKVATKPPLVQKKGESMRVKAFSPGQSEFKLKQNNSNSSINKLQENKSRSPDQTKVSKITVKEVAEVEEEEEKE